MSGAEFVEDVNDDPVIIVDGLTKNWRTPGFRVTWIIGPESLIKVTGYLVVAGERRATQQQSNKYIYVYLLFSQSLFSFDSIILFGFFPS